MSNHVLAKGLALTLARVNANRMSQADLAARANVKKWRIVEAEADRLTLDDDEIRRIGAVIRLTHGNEADFTKMAARPLTPDEALAVAEAFQKLAHDPDARESDKERYAGKVYAILREHGLSEFRMEHADETRYASAALRGEVPADGSQLYKRRS